MSVINDKRRVANSRRDAWQARIRASHFADEAKSPPKSSPSIGETVKRDAHVAKRFCDAGHAMPLKFYVIGRRGDQLIPEESARGGGAEPALPPRSRF